jgi:hypothetical protein
MPLVKKLRLTLKTEADANAQIGRYEKELKGCGEYWARLTDLERQMTVAILREIQSKKTEPDPCVDRTPEVEQGRRQAGDRHADALLGRRGGIQAPESGRREN